MKTEKLNPPGKILEKLFLFRNKFMPIIPVPYKLPWGGWLFLQSDTLSNSIFFATYEEQGQLNIFSKLLQPGMVFFDIGANQGIYSIIASNIVGKNGRVYAFEPVPSEYNKLKLNIRINRLANIVTENVAVGSFAGSTQIYVCESWRGSRSSLVYPTVHPSVKIQRQETKIITLDKYIREMNIHKIDILKMDVEGGERDVLEGARSVFSEGYRPMVLSEVTDRRAEEWGYRARELIDTLRGYEYEWFDVLPDGYELKSHKDQEYYEKADLIAVPEEKVSMIQHFLND